jgi:chromosome segregation ATPase
MDQAQQQKYLAEEKKKRENERFLFNEVSKVVENEIKISRINKIKLLNDWKVVMRIAKIDELRKDITLYLQNFNRELDNKDAILQMLDADIEEAEEHYSIALNNHFIHLQQLINLQDNRIKGLFKEFDKDVTELEMEFKAEFSQIKESYEEEENEINKMLLFINNEKNMKEAKQRDNFRQMKENLLSMIKEKNTKIQEKIQKMADNEVNIFNSELNDIKAKAKEKNQLDKNYTDELNSLDRQIAALKKKVDKLTETYKHMKTKIKQNVEDWDLKNKSLKDEKEKIMESYKKLKDKMMSFRNDQRDKLKKLVKNSYDCKSKLNGYIDLCEKILRLAEICRRLETEREKILPYFKNTEVVQSEVVLPQFDKIFGVDENIYDEIESLRNFWKRYNKVLLDSIAVKRQKEEIEKQNELLKNLLQQCYDGLTVNNVVMNSKENPLLIIDNQSNLYYTLEDKKQTFTLQEGNQIRNEFIKQKKFMN